MMAVAIAVSVIAIAIAGFLAKHTFDRIATAIERVPEAKWFDEVKAACDRVPEVQWFQRVEDTLGKIDPTRIHQHFDRVHTLSNIAMETRMTADRAERDVADHESRIRKLEDKP